MIDPITAKAGASIATTVIKLGWTALKPTLARRKVAAGAKFEYDQVGAYLDSVLDMLVGTAESIPQKFKVAIEQYFSNLPETLAHSYVQKWLEDEEAKACLKRAVLNSFDGIDSSDDERGAAGRLEELGIDARKDAKVIVDDILELLSSQRAARDCETLPVLERSLNSFGQQLRH